MQHCSALLQARDLPRANAYMKDILENFFPTLLKRLFEPEVLEEYKRAVAKCADVDLKRAAPWTPVMTWLGATMRARQVERRRRMQHDVINSWETPNLLDLPETPAHQALVEPKIGGPNSSDSELRERVADGTARGRSA